MKHLSAKLFSLVLPFAVLSSCGGGNQSRTYTKVESESLYVKKVENMDNDFIMGMDASSLIAEEKSGVKYYNYNGEEEDCLKIFSDNGVNYIRVRIWNDPYDAQGHGYGGGNNDIGTAIEIGKRATKYGMKLLLDFHYSDFWADPSKQMVPKAWKGMDYMEKAEAMYDFTKECLQKLKSAGVDVGMVQIGNETNVQFCGETFSPSALKPAYMMNSAARAIRQECPNALIAVHFANPEKNENMKNLAMKLNAQGVDYDVFGSSYYPYWHGTLDNLSETLSYIAETYDKKVMVMETSYAFTTEDTDSWSNTIGTGGFDSAPYPFTVAGQANHVREVTDTIVNKTKNGIGVCYWEGAWIAVQDATSSTFDKSKSQELWEKYGSGWASSYAAEYDPKDAGSWYGGSAVDNQAFFDVHGNALESLKVFNLVRFGNEDAPKYVDGIENAEATIYTDAKNAKLPETVNVIYNDNSKAPLPVTWERWLNTDVTTVEQAQAKGNAKYTIEGHAQGYADPVYLTLTIMEYNYVQNYSFEDNLEPWVMSTEKVRSDTMKILITNENPQTGKYAYHYWGGETGGTEFVVEQKMNLTNSGVYKLQASHLGGDNGDEDQQDHYIYAKINGEIAKTQSFVQTSYSDGYHDVLLEGIEVHDGDEVVIGFHIKSTMKGCWGDVDDVMFNYVSAL